MIIDCFPFFNELDLLEIRLNELKDVVDVFILAEETLTHQGNEKSLYFDDNKHLFSEFNIEHIIVDDYPVDRSDPWAMEGNHRQHIVDHIKKIGVYSTDVILFSDCDELWRADRVKEYAETTGWGRAGAYMPMFSYYMNCLLYKHGWCHARWIKGDHIDIEPQRLGWVDTTFLDVGWHFSYLGDIKKKLAAFAHAEYNIPPYNTSEHIEAGKSELKCLFDDDYKFVIIDDLSFMPRYVLKNFSKFKKYIYIEGYNNA